MRRRVVMTLLAALVLSISLEASAAATAPRDGQAGGVASPDQGGVIIFQPGEEEPGGSPGSVGSGPSRVLIRHVVVNVLLAPCWFEQTVLYPGPVPAADRAAAAQERAAATGLPMCLNIPEVVPLLPTPTQVADPFIRTIPLPVPNPEIDPGYNITGLLAYLETKGSTSHVVDGSTILGPIGVAARGAYYVNWGDGSPEEGPFAFEGQPYPNGRITHFYEYAGLYTVTVREAWFADWRLGGDSGTVTDLQTSASIPLEVRELQAVRQR